MKNVGFISVIILGVASLGSTAMGAESALPSVKNSPLLVSYLENLSEFASGGASIEYFGWSESFAEPTAQCRVSSASAVVMEFEKLAKEIVDGSEPINENAVAEFSRVIGEGDYKFCYNSICQNMSCNHFYSFISQTSKYRIQFEIGYED